MKFVCSDMDNPSAWKETSEPDERKAIEKYFEDNIKVWNPYEGGERTVHFLFDTGKAFRLTYEWWCDYWKDNNDFFVIKEITASETKGIVKKQTMY